MSEKSSRKRVSAQEKVSAVRKHLIEKVPVSEIVDSLGVHPNTYYEWQTQFFSNGEQAFKREEAPLKSELAKIEKLEQKVAHKDLVIAEIMGDFVQLKKSLGEL